MRSTTRRLIGIAVMTLILCSGSLTASADPTAAANPRLRKLGRGLANIITSPAELVRVPYLVGQKEGYLAASSIGLMQGAWRTVVRAAAGVTETLLFFTPTPDNYAPIVKPEFIWTHGNWSE